MKIHSDIKQNSPEWHALRAPIPTASEFSKIVTSKGEPSKSLSEYAIMLAGGMLAKKGIQDFKGNKYTDRGHELEDAARARYEQENELETEQIAFVTDDAITHGCSPDSLVETEGLLEIKNLSGKEHLALMLYYEKHNKMPPKYYPQVQGQIMTCERQWCDLYFNHPDLPPVCIRSQRDTRFIHSLREGIEAIIIERDEVYERLLKIAG